MTRVKICGITTVEDALHAAACGAEMLGFNFYLQSPRYIHPEAARTIIESLPASVETVGVFVNEATPDAVRQIATLAGVQSVQLHGHEDAGYCAALEDLRVIKALRIREEADAEHATMFPGCRILLDSASPSYGGSGNRFDWEIARKIREQVRFLILAGGLDGGSVAEAIARVQPDAVDACSLLEKSPGIKDHDKVQRFIAAAHASRLRVAVESKR